MRIATWNVNGLRARLDLVLRWLRDREPDVVGLQELKLQDAEFPHEIFESVGYHALTHGQKAWNGVAVLSRMPATIIQRGLPGAGEQGARLITADLGNLTFTSVYCPNGKAVQHSDFPLKLAWFEALVNYLRDSQDQDRSSIIGGDFNICPAAIDSWNESAFNGEIFHTEAERVRFRKLLSLGYADLFRSVHPDAHAFSWWDYRGGAFHRKQGLRIDFLLGTAEILKRTVAVEIDRDYRKKIEGLTPSDHAPVWVDLDLPPAG